MHTEKKSSNSLKTHLSASSSKKDTDVALEPKVAPESNYELIEHDSYDSPKLTFGPGQTKFTNEELAADRERRGNINSDPLYAKVASLSTTCCSKKRVSPGSSICTFRII